MFKRIYLDILKKHLHEDRQMIFLVGPRQVGKTTLAKHLKFSPDQQLVYLNWDNPDDQSLIVQGPNAILTQYGLNQIQAIPPMIIFDEIHKYRDWRNFIKGFFDVYGERFKIIVTGSAKLGVYSYGGDSLLGRYFNYRIHPLSIAEISNKNKAINIVDFNQELKLIPQPISDLDFKNLLEYGGFPEPFLKKSKLFYNRWSRAREQKLLNEDIHDLSKIHEITGVKLLATLLKMQASELVNYDNLAKTVKVSSETIKSWIQTLSNLYFCFSVQPWHTNLARAILKQPKIYLWDWAVVKNPGSKYENFIAVHLLKAVNFWTDCGLGEYNLYFVRTKDKEEVDFLVTKDDHPWFLVEVKASSNNSINSSLYKFHKLLKTQHAFQVVFDLPYVQKNCFEYSEPVIVPVQTFCSQLI